MPYGLISSNPTLQTQIEGKSLLTSTSCCNSTASGSSDKTLVFIQTLPSAIWNIPHFLDKYPSIHFFDNEGNELYPEFKYPSVDIIEATFSEEVSGKAFLN
jgi:hypothetical protein